MSNEELQRRIQGLSPAKRALLERQLGGSGGRSISQAIPRRGTLDPCVLSFNQQRQWFLERLDPGSAAYNVWTALRLTGRLDVSALRGALEAVVERHEILRTRFLERDGEPLQAVGKAPGLRIDDEDLSTIEEGERVREAGKLAALRTTMALDLNGGEIARVVLYRLSEIDHVLLLVLNHIASDAWSRRIFMRDLGEAYSSLVASTEPEWPDLPVQYADFSVWQRKEFGGERLASQLSYWMTRLEGSPPTLDLIPDHPRPAVISHSGASADSVLDPTTVTRLTDFAIRENATPFMVLVAIYSRLLSVYSAQDDIVIGIPISGRRHPALEKLIGFFANSLPLRFDLKGDPSFRTLLARVREESLGAFANQDLPFERLVDALHPQRDSSRTPVFQTMFSLQNIPDPPLRFEGLETSRFPVGSGAAPFDFFLRIIPEKEGWRCQIRYNCDLYESSTIERLLKHFGVLLERALDDPDRPLSELAVTGDEEERRARIDWNATRSAYPRDATVNQLFEARVAESPDAPALVLGPRMMTYAELNSAANRLAHYLRASGVGPEVVVGVMAERTIETMVALLGVLKAGGAYLPLDPDQPEARLSFMLSDSAAKVLLTQGGASRAASMEGARVIDLEAAHIAIGEESDRNPGDLTTPDSLAYLIYTSGSTGRPKGVQVVHRNIIRLVSGASYLPFGSDQTFLQLAPVSFDASTFEIWGALLNGSKCVVFPERVPSAARLRTVIGEEGVTTLFLTTALFNAIVDEAPGSLGGVKELLVGGEALSTAHVTKAQEALPHTQMINVYGPTECTTFSTAYPIPRRDWTRERSVPIGGPISNGTAYILDGAGRICPVGAPGELCIGGDGVARGYLGDPELTASRFVLDPFSEEPGARMYRTGDRCRYLDGGLIEFLGRDDDQIKLRGFRIEPKEIENTLMRHQDVRAAVVTPTRDPAGGSCLVAHVVPARGDRVPAVEELKQHLQGELPAYMIPSAFVMVEELPLTTGGKVDKRRLPPPVFHAKNENADRPTDAVELQLASIWARVLGVGDLGLDDDFFDLGGNSLLALRLFADIEATLGKNLPLAVLFSAPTIRELAGKIRERDPEAGWDVIVPIQRKGHRPPFFCVHGAGGNIVGQVGLARLMDPEQPYYGIQARGLGGRGWPLRSVKRMASLYVSEIRKIRPRGPYFLGGYCLGGMVAFEMARMLAAEGEEVPLLVMIDPAPVAGFLLDGPRHLQKVMTSWGTILRRFWAIHDQVWERHVLARLSYDPDTYSGNVLYFRSAAWGGDPARVQTLQDRWMGFMKGETDAHVIETAHALILSAPAVDEIATVINQKITELLGGESI